MTAPTPRWIDRLRSHDTLARVIQTLIDAGYEPGDARRLVFDAANDHANDHAKEAAR